MSKVRKTIQTPAVVDGLGLHSGQAVRVRLLPGQPGGGIVFCRVDLAGGPQLTVEDLFLDGPPLRSALRQGSVEVHTLEHLMAALHGLGVTDLRVELDRAELPGLDGSALPWAEALQAAGITELPGLAGADGAELVVEEVLSLSEGQQQLVAIPYPEGLRISYALHYPDEPLAQGFASFLITPAVFLSKLAPARTFCLRAEAEALQAAGFGRGAGTHNTLVLDRGRVLENTLRFSDEPVRHKILDLLGDVFLAGLPLRAHLVAHRSGHALNRRLAVLLRQKARRGGAG